MAEAAREQRKRTVKLFCPSVPKIVQIVEREDQRLDLGFIACAFGLDPNTLKLNGHFISRGVDFIASSVTWKSLIGFFSARGLSTGGTDSDALLVHGKLSSAPKRGHDLVDAETRIVATNQHGYVRNCKRQQVEYTKMLENDSTKIKSGPVDLSIRTAWSNGPDAFSLKRKLWLEDDSHLKRSRVYEVFPDVCSRHLLDGNGSTTSNRRSPCSFFSKNTKRMRDEETVSTTSSKKIR